MFFYLIQSKPAGLWFYDDPVGVIKLRKYRGTKNGFSGDNGTDNHDKIAEAFTVHAALRIQV